MRKFWLIGLVAGLLVMATEVRAAGRKIDATVTPDPVVTGATYTVNACGFRRDSTVVVDTFGSLQPAGVRIMVQADGNGCISYSATAGIPDMYRIQFQAEKGGQGDGTRLLGWVDFKVVA